MSSSNSHASRARQPRAGCQPHEHRHRRQTDNRRLGLQVGSPVLLGLAGCYRFATARAAYAVVADVQRQRGDRWGAGRLVSGQRAGGR